MFMYGTWFCNEMTISRCRRGLGTVNIVNTLRFDVISVWIIGGRTIVTADRRFRIYTLRDSFLPHDAMRKRGPCCRPVRVRPSLSVRHVGALYPHGWRKISSNVFLGPIGPIILVFDPSASTQFQGEPLQRDEQYTEVGKNCDFRLKSPFISETVRHRPMVAMER